MDYDKTILEKFEIYKAVQTLGWYNMFSVEARILANEMSEEELGEELTRSEWLYIMKNYESLMKANEERFVPFIGLKSTME